MEHDEIVDHAEQGDAVNQSSCEDDDNSSSPVKRGRGRPKGPVKVQQDSDVTNGGDVTPKRGRGRPKLSETQPAASSDDTDSTPKKRGRPKGSPRKPSASENESNGDLVNGSAEPKKGRGRPKKSTDDSAAIGGSPRKRGRPRKEDGGESNGVSPRRGRPRKSLSNGGELVKRGRGRPKGSPTKKAFSSSRLQVESPNKTGKRGRPRNQPAKRGRPRKYPVSSSPKKKRNRVWKPLGRPRKYPREEPPEGSSADGEGSALVVRRGRGRPRKSESKKGAHLRKKLPLATESSGPPRKRGRPPSAPKQESDIEGAKANEDEAPRKRGRPASAPKQESDNEGATANEDPTPRKRGRPKSSIKRAGKGSKDDGTPANNCEAVSMVEAEEPQDEAEETVEEPVQDEMLVH